MVHPSNGEAWKTFDMEYKDFATEFRNVGVGSQSPKALTPNTGMEKVRGVKEACEREQTEARRLKNEGLKCVSIQ
jgi:hypothetical protein